jgi:signal transduction histidine kinase
MSKPYTILHVEDTPENQVLVRRILESENYHIVDAANAMEGIKKAVDLHPDLILMDINLPDMDGFTAVTRIRSFQHLRAVPIIALTARSVSDDRERAKAIGCDGYLNKPFDLDELIEAVAHHLAAGHQDDDATTWREFYLKEQSVTLIEQLEHKIGELKVAYERLEHLEKVKSDFISIVSHELRTPLTIISSYVQMLQMLPDIHSNQAAKEYITGVTQGTDRLQEIINDMVSVIRMELSSRDRTFVPVSLRNIVQMIEQEQARTVQARRLNLVIDIAKDLPMVFGDTKQLHSALNRIINNAIKYTPDGGFIGLKVHPITAPGERTFAEIVITDTGVGIARDKQQLIFDKFGTAAENIMLHSTSKTDFKGGGIGLGLTIARGIIEFHDGKIWVESPGFDPEKLPGSRFFIHLPV